MQRIFFLFGLFVFSIVWQGEAVYSQNSNLNKAISYFGDYQKFNDLKSFTIAKERIDSASKHPATIDKYKTWFYKGQIYLAAFDQTLKAEMNKSAETDINKKIISAYNSISMAEIDEAMVSFEKAIELDEKKVYVDDSKAKLKVIASHYGDKAYANLVNKNYQDALKFYDKSFDMKLKMGITDTAAMNNMAVSAVKIKDYKKAEQCFNKLIEMNYKPEKWYMSLIQMYNEAGDTASARTIITKAAAALPESYLILIEQINLFLRDGKSEAAVNSINHALVKNPNNHELHLVLGQTYNRMAFPKDTAGKELPRPANSAELAKKAEQEFNKTIAIKGDYVVGLYSAGIFYNNMGADILKQSENIKDPKKRKIEEDNADAFFRKAIPLLEKAHGLDPGDKLTMFTLRQLYARTGQGDSEKYRKLNEDLKR